MQDKDFDLEDTQTDFKRLDDQPISKEDKYNDSKKTTPRFSRQLNLNGYEEEKKAEDEIIPKLALFKTGMADATRRYDIINKRVREEFDVFIDELKHANDGSLLYTTIADYFKSERPNDLNEIPNGWEVLIRETICKLYSLGELWGTPEIQRKKVNWRHNVLFISQLFEFGFAFSNGGLTLKDDYEKIIGNNAFFGTVLGLLVFQAIVSTYVNWRGINRKADSQGTIAPVIRIGDKVLIGTTEEQYDEKIHDKLINAKFVIDPQFRPYQKSAMGYVKRKEYNPLAVDFAIHGLDLWYTSQKKYYEWPVLPKITAALNAPSFTWTNLYGALLNSYIFLFLADYIENPIGKILFGAPFVLCSVYAGNYYYKAFTTANVKAAVSKFWTSEDPLTQTGMISFWQRVEVETQWLLNSIARALSIGLSGFSVLQLVIKFITNFIETNETTMSYINEVLFINSVFSTLMAFLNTAFSRKKGAEKYLEPFNITGFSSLDKFIVPSEKLLLTWKHKPTPEKLTQSEIIHDVVPWAIFYGMTFALPAWMLCSKATTFEYWHILVAVTVWVVKSLLTALAEIPHKSHEKAINAIKKIIGSEEEKPAYDSNGNELLTLDETSTFNKVLNILEQLSRILGRAGSFGGFLMMYGLPHFESWFGTEIPFVTPNAVFISVILLTPAINEFSIYATATKKLVNQDINDIRELAGTPVEEIKGWGFSHFLARQLVAFMPYVFVKKKKPIQGITNVTWSQWFSGCWSYSKLGRTSERDETNTEQKGCWSCFGRLFSGRNEPTRRDSFSGAESFQGNINSQSENVFV